MNIRQGERTPLLMAALGAFLSIATVVLGRTLSDAILLSVYPAVNVANFIIYSSGALMAVSVIYFRLLRAMNAAKLNAGFLILFALGTIAFEIVGMREHGPWFIYAYATFLITAPALGNIIVWNAIGDAFNPRQGRRLFHVVCAASTCGGIAAGFLAPPLRSLFGFSSLPIAYSLLFACSTFIVIMLHRKRRSERTMATSVKEKSNSLVQEFLAGFNDFIGSPLIRNLSIVFLLTAVTTNIIDFSLKLYLQANYDKAGIVTFYGYFNTVSNTFNLVVQLTLLSSFLTRFRTRTLFAITPLVLLAFTCPFIFTYSAVCVILMRFMDVALRFVIQDAAREIALSPLPRLLRNRAKVIFKGVMNPIGGIGAGIILNMLLPYMGARYLPLLIIPVAALSLFCVRNLNRYCANHLFTSLQASAVKEGLLSEEHEQDHDEEEKNIEFNQPELLADDDDNIRLAALESALNVKSHDEDAICTPEIRTYATRLIEHDALLAQATLVLQNYFLSDDKNICNALSRTYDIAIQRIFKGLMLLHKVEIVETVFQALASSKSATRAQALELLQLTISSANASYAKRILILCDDFELEDKCTRLESQIHMGVEGAIDVMQKETSRSMRKLVTEIKGACERKNKEISDSPDLEND